MNAIIELLARFIQALFGVKEQPPKPPVTPDVTKPKPVESPSQSVRGDFTDITIDDLLPVLSSPLKPYAPAFVEAGHQNDLDPRFLASISMLETGRGTSQAFLVKKNAMGISDKDGAIRMPSVSRSIFRMAERIDEANGPYAGADTIAEIGAIYSPPGAGNDPNGTNSGWPYNVGKFYEQFLGSAPAPKPPKKPAVAGKIRLPKSSTLNLNRFYGTASRSGSYLTWFQFPVDDVVLYHRGGTGLKDKDGDGRDEHRCHKAVKDSLQAAFQEIYDTIGEERFHEEGWHVFGGCFNYRTKVGGSSLSEHSWGIAVDMHPGGNGWKHYGTTFSDEAINIMEKHGWLSAGRAWGHDYMHFSRAIPRVSPGSHYAKYGIPNHIIEA